MRVYWVSLAEDRDGFAQQIRLERQHAPIVPFVLRRQGMFGDPNSVMNDVQNVLDSVRDEIVEYRRALSSGEGLAVVLLSKTPWVMAITSSPMVLPDWFPVTPNKLVTVRVEDLTWSTRVTLRDGALALEEMHRLLYEIEDILVTRLGRSYNANHNRVQAFWANIRRDNDPGIAEGIREARKKLDEILNPTNYRPSMRGATMVGRIWKKANGTGPEGLVKTARVLARALGLDDSLEFSEAPLVAVLNRPTNRIERKCDYWSFSLILALRNSCQLVTAAAHADEYPRYPVTLLRSMSNDLRYFLDSAISLLQEE